MVEPELASGARTTFVQWTPTYWVSPESWRHRGNNPGAIPGPKRRNKGETVNLVPNSYLGLLIILDLCLNLEEPGQGCPAQPGLTWRNPVRVASPHRINLEEPISSGYPAPTGLIRSSVCETVRAKRGIE